MDNYEFHTFREYMNNINRNLTASMEDYLEMICRLSQESGYTRINELSDALNVQPSSATKMVQKLAENNLLKYERYGIIRLKKEGLNLGNILLKRHNIIETFLKTLGVKEDQLLTETEKIEHTISEETLACFISFVNFLNENESIKKEFKNFKQKN